MRNKDEVRRETLARRKALSPDYREQASERIIKTLKETTEWTYADVVYLYYSYGSEVRTIDLLRETIEETDKQVQLPRVISDEEIFFFDFYDFNDLEEGAYGIMEPKTPEDIYILDTDLIVVPCVAVDRKGNRVGHGKGYYDRYLADWEDVPKICLAYDCQIVEDAEPDDTDIKIDIIITETEVIRT